MIKNVVIFGMVIFLLAIATSVNVTVRDLVSPEVRDLVNLLLILMFTALAIYIYNTEDSLVIRKVPGFERGLADVVEFTTFMILVIAATAFVGYLGNQLAEAIWQWIGGSTIQDTYVIVRGSVVCILVSLAVAYFLWSKSCAATVIASFVAAVAAGVWFAALGPVNVLNGIWNGYLTLGAALQVAISTGTMFVGTVVALFRTASPLYARFVRR